MAYRRYFVPGQNTSTWTAWFVNFHGLSQDPLPKGPIIATGEQLTKA